MDHKQSCNEKLTKKHAKIQGWNYISTLALKELHMYPIHIQTCILQVQNPFHGTQQCYFQLKVPMQ